MRHTVWTGPHYEAGRQQGALLRTENRPFSSLFGPLSLERSAYATACIPIYEQQAPALLDELRGLADGAQIPFADAAAFLLGMYAFPAGNGCTCFAVDTGDDVIFGRNSDFLTAFAPLYEHCHYSLTNAYSFSGNTTAFSEMEDGVNEYGLAVGMTFVYPTVCRPGLHAGYLVRHLLEHCKTTEEAISELSHLTIGSSQTLTLADASGQIAVAECNAERLTIRRPVPGTHGAAAVNDFRTPEMSPFRYDRTDDLHSGLRWQTATRCLRENQIHSLKDACALLSGKYGFLCQYDRTQGFDTVWSVACTLRSRQLLLCEGNPAKNPFRELPFPSAQ